jgi:2'-5' RNA ligase
MRCFVAVDLPDPVRDAVRRAQGALRAAAPDADVRWTGAAQLHVTLAFLGEIDPARAAAATDALRAVAGGRAAFPLRAAGLGAFPTARRPRVVWAGIDDPAGGLRALAADVAAALAPLGLAPEARPFRGHVTLARVRSPRGTAPLVRALGAATAPAFGAWSVAAVVLYRSHLHPQGARYEPLAALPLGGGTT